jgi:hypothetical protein
MGGTVNLETSQVMIEAVAESKLRYLPGAQRPTSSSLVSKCQSWMDCSLLDFPGMVNDYPSNSAKFSPGEYIVEPLNEAVQCHFELAFKDR